MIYCSLQAQNIKIIEDGWCKAKTQKAAYERLYKKEVSTK
jgi:hypothetical protein